MQLSQVDTIPSGCTMQESAYIYVASDGSVYVQFCPGGNPEGAMCYRSVDNRPVMLEAADKP